MEQMYHISHATMNALLLQLASTQKRLIDTQQELMKSQKRVISLHKKLEKKVPLNPRDENAFWHIASGGMMSFEAANSKDLATVRKFEEWNIQFAEKYIKPYVSPKVFSECVNQMTRGLPERIATLETQEELRLLNNGHKSKTPASSVR